MDNIMQNKYIKIFLFLLSIFVFMLVIGEMQEVIGKVKSGQPDKDTLTISATGEVDASPDIATADFAVLTEGREPGPIQEQNTEKINKIVEFLKAQGIEDKDIKTQNYSLYPRYNYDEGRQTLIGYSINQTVSVKMRDLDKVGDIIDGVVANGANTVSGLFFSIEDPDELTQQARKEALEKAKDKAQELADVAGVRLGKVLSFSENGTPPYTPYPQPYYSEDRAVLGLGGAESAPSIEPGSTKITATVSVTFELK